MIPSGITLPWSSLAAQAGQLPTPVEYDVPFISKCESSFILCKFQEIVPKYTVHCLKTKFL